MKCIVVIGTYNEAENIPSLLPEIIALGDQYEAIVVDDSSPDGTGELVEKLSFNQPRIHAVHRARRLGYGTAYLKVSGRPCRWALITSSRWTRTIPIILRTYLVSSRL